MEKRGICAHVTHGFAVFPEAKTGNEWVTARINHTLPWCNQLILYCACAVQQLPELSREKCGIRAYVIHTY